VFWRKFFVRMLPIDFMLDNVSSCSDKYTVSQSRKTQRRSNEDNGKKSWLIGAGTAKTENNAHLIPAGLRQPTFLQ